MSVGARAVVAVAVVAALHPIYWIVAAMGVVGFGFAMILEEVPLINRMVPREE